MPLVAVIGFISFLAAIVALIVLLHGWNRALPNDIKLLIVGLLGLTLFHHFSNILEWGGISRALDPYEDFLELLTPMLWFFIFYGYFKELTTDDLRKSQGELQESKEKYASLANNLNVGIYRNIMGSNGKFIEANPAIVEMFGFNNREEFLKLKVSDLYKNPDDKKEYNTKILKEGSVRNHELQLRKKDGTAFIGSISAVIVKDEKGEVKYSDGIIEDITERKRTAKRIRESEEKLARSKKMESLGLLAGGVAHDLNNVLAGIVSYPELLLMDLPEDSKLRKPIETMQESGHRAAAIVQDLLTVAKGVATTKEPLYLNDLVRDYVNSPEFKKLKQYYPTVLVKTNLEKDLLNISGSNVHIRKVVMNLVSNASEAIDGSGIVTISTMNRHLDRPLRGYDNVNTGEYVVLSVSDNG
jgi:PAS domain S-box-containing protein